MTLPILDRLILDLVREAGLPSATRPQEHRMSQDRIIITLDRQTAGEWTAGAARGTNAVRRNGSLVAEGELVQRVGESPAEVLELIGRELDEREASRLSRDTRAQRAGETPAGPFTVEDAVELALIRDVARVVDVIEGEDRRQPGIVLRTVTIAHLAGIAGEELAQGGGGSPATVRQRTIRALRRAQSDGVVAEAGRMQRAEDTDDGDLLWSVANAAETEELSR